MCSYQSAKFCMQEGGRILPVEDTSVIGVLLPTTFCHWEQYSTGLVDFQPTLMYKLSSQVYLYLRVRPNSDCVCIWGDPAAQPTTKGKRYGRSQHEHDSSKLYTDKGSHCLLKSGKKIWKELPSVGFQNKAVTEFLWYCSSPSLPTNHKVHSRFFHLDVSQSKTIFHVTAI